MKHIVKSKEPDSLLRYRKQKEGEANFDNLPAEVKRELRAALLKEQGHVCCYCMRRIGEENTTVEHWKPKKKYPRLQLDYYNLLASCNGQSHCNQSHCNHKKGNREITVNPCDKVKNCENHIRYNPDGEISSDILDIKKDLNKVLNLNNQTLKQNRRIVLDTAIRMMPKGKWSNRVLQKVITKWSKPGRSDNYQPYCGIVLFYFKKKLNKFESSKRVDC